MVNETALHLAARGGHTGIVRALLAAGLDPNVKARGKTPWMEAEAGGHAETAQVLAATAAPPDIFQAALGGSVETVAALLAADPALARARSAAGHTPLHSAAAGGHEPVVRLLVDQGADVNALDERHMAPLHLAAQEGYEGIVALLLERGADVNGGQTPERQAGFTPLHTASMSGHLGIMRLLLDRGADLTLLDEAGQTALDWANEAESERWREAARLLQEAAKATRGR
jgi:cytohesin